MSLNQHEPLTFIETIDDDTLHTIIKKDDYDDKYDQLSQIRTGWNVVVIQEEEYDADDENIKD